jgi:hypothetical protein
MEALDVEAREVHILERGLHKAGRRCRRIEADSRQATGERWRSWQCNPNPNGERRFVGHVNPPIAEWLQQQRVDDELGDQIARVRATQVIGDALSVVISN